MTTTKFDPMRLPEPDSMGFFMHPDVPGEEEDDDVAAMLHEMGFEFSTVCFEIEADENDADAWFCGDLASNEAQAIMVRWQPTNPPGDGWILVSKYDTEDGPQALFVRPVQPPKGGD